MGAWMFGSPSATIAPPGSAIVRRDVGYQVKVEDMPRGKILTEMRSNDALREYMGGSDRSHIG